MHGVVTQVNEGLMGPKILDLLAQSVIVQGVVTIGWGITTSILLIQRAPIDDKWWIVGTALIAFWFGGKAVMVAQATLEKAKTSNDKST